MVNNVLPWDFVNIKDAKDRKLQKMILEDSANTEFYIINYDATEFFKKFGRDWEEIQLVPHHYVFNEDEETYDKKDKILACAYAIKRSQV